MDEERVRIRGRLAECERQFDQLDLSAGSDITTVRNYLDAFEPDVTKLRTNEAKIAMDRLHATIEQMKELKERIQKLREAIE